MEKDLNTAKTWLECEVLGRDAAEMFACQFSLNIVLKSCRNQSCVSVTKQHKCAGKILARVKILGKKKGETSYRMI